MSQTYYFSHDYNSRTNPKIKKVLVKHGITGYGVYWAIVEDLYNNANALPTDYDCIAYDLRVDSETIKSIINDFDLFTVSDGVFSSRSVEKRLNAREEKSAKARDSALKRWSKDANALPPKSKGNANKGKESKEKGSKEKEIKPDAPTKISYRANVELYESEYKTLIEKYGIAKTDWMLDKLSSYKESNAKKYVSDYGAINSWVVDSATKNYTAPTLFTQPNQPKKFSIQQQIAEQEARR